MRDYHLQTPQKPNRHSKSFFDPAKKNQKTVKKSLNAALSAVPDDVFVLESTKDLSDFTLISETSEDNLICESSQDLTSSLTDEASPGSEAAASVLAPLSSTITCNNYEKGVASVSQSRVAKLENVNLSCIEAELVVKHLKESQLQLLNARAMDLQYKRLLYVLIDTIIQDLYGLPEEEKGYNKLIPGKAYLAFLSFLLSVFAATVILIFFSGYRYTSSGPSTT